MDRRELLRWSTSTFALWSARALGHGREAPLDRAIRAARAAGKPVLVLALLVPDDPQRVQALGRALGEMFAMCGDELYADLALVEAACATRAQLARWTDDEIEADIGLLEFEEGRPRWRPVGISLEVFTRTYWPGEAGRFSYQGAVMRCVDTLRDAIAADEAMLEARVDSARAALPPKALSQIEFAIALRPLVPVALVDQGAALFRRAMEESREARRCWRPLLVQAATERLDNRAPEGARWMDDRGRGGCGGGPCGTAATPARSGRFLAFYTQG